MRIFTLLTIIIIFSSCERKYIEMKELSTNQRCFLYTTETPVCINSNTTLDSTIPIYGIYMSKSDLIFGKVKEVTSDITNISITDMIIINKQKNKYVTLSNDSNHVTTVVDSNIYNNVNIGDYIYIIYPSDLLLSGSYIIRSNIHMNITEEKPKPVSVEMNLSEN